MSDAGHSGALGGPGGVYALLAAQLERSEPCATATIVSAKGSIPNGVGAMMLVGPGGVLLAGTVGGGRIEARVLVEAGLALDAGESRMVAAKLTEEEAGGIGMMCGGQVQVFINVHVPSARLFLCGAGHINVALAALAHSLGFAVTVMDDRAEWANAAHYPHAVVITRPPEEALAELNVDAQSFVVVATRADDHLAIVAASKTPARYIGVVASRRKAIALTRRVVASGSAPTSASAPAVGLQGGVDALLQRLYAPVGLDLGGQTPEAIALSIISEIQALRQGREAAVAAASMRIKPEQMACYLQDKRSR